MALSKEEKEALQRAFSGSDSSAARKSKKGSGDQSFLSSLISELGGTGGAVGGAAIGSAFGPLGTLAGAGIGGLLGGFGGSAVEQQVRDKEIDFAKAGREGALEGLFAAGPLKLAKVGKGLATAGKIGAKEAAAQATKKSTSRLGNKLLRKGTIADVSTMGTASQQRSLMEVARKFPELAGKGTNKFQNVEKVIGKLGDEVDDLVKGVQGSVPSSRFTDLANEIMGTMDAGQARTFNRIFKDVSKKAKSLNKSDLNATDINRFRKEINKQASRAFKSQEKGGVLSAADNAVMELRDLSDELLESLVPKETLGSVRALNKDVSVLIKGIPEFKKLSEEAVTLGVGKIPILGKGASQAVQGGADRLGRGLTSDAAQTAGEILPTARGVLTGSGVENLLFPEQPQGNEDVVGALQADSGDLSSLLGDQFGGAQFEEQPGRTGFTNSQLEEAMIIDLLQNGGENMEVFEQLLSLNGGSERDLTADQKNQISKIEGIQTSVGRLVELFDSAGGGQGLGGLVSSTLGRTPGVRSLGLAPEAQEFEDLRKGLIATLARAISGEVGVLTDKDVSRAEGFVPRLSDPPEVARNKIQSLQKLLQAQLQTPSLTGADEQMALLQQLGGGF